MVLWIQSLIFTLLMFSLKYKLRLRTFWSSIFKKLWLQVYLRFNLLEFKESLIFQIFNLSKDDLEVDKNFGCMCFVWGSCYFVYDVGKLSCLFYNYLYVTSHRSWSLYRRYSLCTSLLYNYQVLVEHKFSNCLTMCKQNSRFT